MKLGRTWFGRISTYLGDDDVTVDTAKLLRYLLLFDRVIVHSSRLLEFPTLARELGAGGLSALLRSGAIGVHCHALTTAQTGQSDIGGRTRPLPHGSYSFRSISEAGRKAYLHSCFKNITPSRDLPYKQCKRLKRDIADKLVDPVDSVRKEMEEQLLSDLRASVPQFRTALSVELQRNFGNSVEPSDLTLKIHEFSERDFRVESSLYRVTTLDDLARHKATERALLAVGGLNQRLAEMNGYSAVTDFWHRDLPVLDRKLRYLSEFAPERRDQALAKLLTLPGLPDIAEELAQGGVEIERFLEIRASPEGQQFRQWLQSLGPDDVEELEAQWGRFCNKLGAWIAAPRGKALRFLISTGAGLLPVAGVAVSAVDRFLLEKWLPHSQPLTFLQHFYTSIFRAPGDDTHTR